MRLGFVLALIALAAFAGDQGKPGTQGPWPVAIVSGGWTPDGGFVGTSVMTQGVGADGGPAWIADGTIIPGSTRWTLCGEFDVAAWLALGNSLPGSTPGYAIGFPPDGGTTMEAGRISSTNPLADLGVRMDDCLGYAIMATYQAAGCNTTTTINLYVYGNSNAIQVMRDGGATTAVGYATTQTITAAVSVGIISAHGWGSTYSGAAPVYTSPIRPGFLFATVAAGAGTAVTSCTHALYQVWVMR